jgi:hypothetical protein
MDVTVIADTNPSLVMTVTVSTFLHMGGVMRFNVKGGFPISIIHRTWILPTCFSKPNPTVGRPISPQSQYENLNVVIALAGR